MRVPLRVYVLLLPLWLPIAAGTAVAAGSGSPYAGAALLLVLGYPVAVVAAAVGSRRARTPRTARRWTLLPLPWVLLLVGVVVLSA